MLRDRIRPWWNEWRAPVLLLLAGLVYATIQPYLFAWLESLPVLAQQAAGLLVLAAILGLIYWHYRLDPHPFNVFLAGAFIAFALVIAGVWPAVTVPLTWVFLAAAAISVVGGLIWQFVQDRRKA